MTLKLSGRRASVIACLCISAVKSDLGKLPSLRPPEVLFHSALKEGSVMSGDV